jgi:multidrug efflux system outer membrane protein
MKLLPLLLFLLTSACAMGPDYRRPDMSPPEAFMETAPPGESIANMPWWELFKDETLQELIRTALAENKDMKTAVARIDEARAALGYTRADQYPSLGYMGRASKSELYSPNFLYPLAPRLMPAYADVSSKDLLVSADASFTVDLWGRLRRSTESSRATLMASEEAYRTVTITLVSDVATTYLLLRQLDTQRKIASDTLAARRESLRLIQAKFDHGWVTLLDLEMAKMQEANAAGTLTAIDRGISQAEHALSFLLGRAPGPIPRGKLLEEQVFPPEIPSGLPSQLLDRRPDIRTAEANLHAQTALIGVTQALMLPNFSLTGAYGHESLELTSYPNGYGNFWSLGASLMGPLFQFGKNKRRVEIQKAKTEEALLTYEKAFLNGLREVEDGLVAVRTYKDEYEDVLRGLESARSAAKLSHARYDEGFSSYLEVLEMDMLLFSTELQAASILQQRLAATISLYKALGGGWPMEPGGGSEEARKSGSEEQGSKE